MTQPITKRINDFSGGMTSEERLNNSRFATLIKGFDAHTFKKKLVPNRSSEDGDTAAATSQKRNFCLAVRTGTAWYLYALGVISGTGKAEVMMKDLATLDTSGWNTPNNNQSSAGSTNFNLFVYYKKTGLIYGAREGTHIWAFDPTSAVAWNDDIITTNGGSPFTYTNMAQGLVHSKDDILYIPYDNKIAKNDNGSWTNAILTLPSHFKITSICEYGNFLAIAATPVSSYGKAKIFLWDMSSIVWNEEIEVGEGALQVLENVEGTLIGISYITSFVSSLGEKIVIRSYPKRFEPIELISSSTAADALRIAKQKINKYLYFLGNLEINGVALSGLWKVDANGKVVFDRTPNNDVAPQTLWNFFSVKNCFFISYINSGGAYALSKTNDQAAYSSSSYYETLKINGGDSDLKKKLVGATVMFEPLPSAGKVSLKYRKDEETSWTTIFVDFTTDNAMSHGAINIESSGAKLPEFNEIQFQIISYGGAVITGLKYKYDIVGKSLYE